MSAAAILTTLREGGRLTVREDRTGRCTAVLREQSYGDGETPRSGRVSYLDAANAVRMAGVRLLSDVDTGLADVRVYDFLAPVEDEASPTLAGAEA